MINSLMISKTGMTAQQTQLDVISNNLANVSTNGFKRSNAVFEDLMYQNLRQVGANANEQAELPTGLQVGLGVRTVATSRSFTQGSLQQSGNALDVAINGQGFFQVQMPDGTTAYTRDGSFQLNAQGQLVTNSGYPLSAGITLPAETTSITISGDGIVSAKLPGTTQPQQVGVLELANFINPAGLEPLGQNLFRESVASGNPVNAAPGSTGMGSTPHLAMEDLLGAQQIQYTHVPFKGTTDQMLALASGNIMAGVNSTGFAPWVEQGKLRLLAVFSEQRSTRWPQVPTMKELGFAQAVYHSPWGLVAPTGTPPAVLSQLHDAFKAAMFSARHLSELQRYDQDVSYLDSTAYRQMLIQSSQRERKLLQRMKLLAE